MHLFHLEERFLEAVFSLCAVFFFLVILVQIYFSVCLCGVFEDVLLVRAFLRKCSICLFWVEMFLF